MKYGNMVKGLPALCATLPDNPAAAAPDFLARRLEQLALIKANRDAKAKPPVRRRASALDRLLDL